MRITTKDAQRLLDCSEHTARKHIHICRAALGKQAHQKLSIEEFCAYYDIKP